VQVLMVEKSKVLDIAWTHIEDWSIYEKGSVFKFDGFGDFYCGVSRQGQAAMFRQEGD